MTPLVEVLDPQVSVVRRRFALLVGLIVMTLALLGWTVSFPGVPFSLVGLSGLGCVAVAVLAVRTLRQDRNRIHPALVVGIVVTAVVLGVNVVTASAPRTLRFDASRPAFDAVVAGRVPLPLSSFAGDSWNGSDEPSSEDRATFASFPGDCPGVIGTYAIADCRAVEGGFLFLQQENAVTDDSGIAWLPDGLQPDRPDGTGLGSSGFTHLQGPWYSWSCYC